MIAAGLRRHRRELELEAAFDGNAYESGRPSASRRRLARRWTSGGQRGRTRRRSATRSVDHYANMAEVELAAFDAAVTDWERIRGFERL